MKTNMVMWVGSEEPIHQNYQCVSITELENTVDSSSAFNYLSMYVSTHLSPSIRASQFSVLPK